jgi:hypothetical protein
MASTTPPAKSTALNLRISPDKKVALANLAAKQRLDISKLVMPLIDRLLTEAHLDAPGTPEFEAEGQGEEPELTGQFSFWPLPGDERFVKKYAAARNMKPATVLKLIVRAWITHNAPIPKHELAALGITSNQLGALGRNLNQLINHAHAGNYPLPEELLALLERALYLSQQARKEVGAIVKANIASWENDHA